MTELEKEMLLHIRVVKLPPHEQEFRFHPVRKWRFDFAWPELMIALECEGGTHARYDKLCPCCKQPPRSRHTTGTGFDGDCEKYNEATALGWRVIRVTASMVRSGMAINQIERMIENA